MSSTDPQALEPFDLKYLPITYYKFIVMKEVKRYNSFCGSDTPDKVV